MKKYEFHSIQALLFDLDETLAADSESIRLSLERVIPNIIAHYPHLTAELLFTTFKRINNRHWEHFEDSPLKNLTDPIVVRTYICNEVFQTLNINNPPFAQRIAQEFQRARLETYQCFADTLPVLKALHGTLHLILVTNGNSRMQRDKIRICGLEPWLDVIFIAQEVGISKPDPQIFWKAVHSVDVEPAQALMIGDHPEKDILGAKSIGCRTAWMRRKPNKPFSLDPQPDYIVQNLNEVVDILTKISNLNLACQP